MNSFLDELNEVEIDPTGLCNLTCNFCPRATFYPNTNNHMSDHVADTIIQQMLDFDFRGIVSITGKGEPTLHNDFENLVKKFSVGKWILKINTNGKRFDKYKDVIVGNFHTVFYNCYEFTEQQYRDKVEELSPYKNVVVKWRPNNIQWFEDAPRYTNRAGSFETNYVPDEKRCDVIFHKMFIDYNGVYRLCCEDWQYELTMGNIFDEPISEYIENNPILKEYRKNLVEGIRDDIPCNKCSYSLADFKYRTTLEKMEQYKWLVKAENLGV